MSAWTKEMTAEERDLVTAIVMEAYEAEDGTVRSHRDAAAKFTTAMHALDAKGSEYARKLLNEWADAGAAAFAQRLWSRRDAFTATVKNASRTRRLKRGALRVDDHGKTAWTQPSILDLTGAEVESALRDEIQRVDEGKFNIAWLSQVVKLCRRHPEAETVATALKAEGFATLDDFLISQVAS